MARLCLLLIVSALADRATPAADQLTLVGIAEFTAACEVWYEKRRAGAKDVPLLAGGRAMPACHDGLNGLGAVQVAALAHFSAAPDRRGRPASGKTT
jgi:hypothetical protein